MNIASLLKMLESPPAGQSFVAREALEKYLKSFAVSQGYAVSVRSSSKTSVTFKCDRGGSYRDNNKTPKDASQQRDTSSRLIGCNWRVTGSLHSSDGRWHLNITNGEHSNHSASENMIGHSRARGLNDQQEAVVNNMLKSGTAPKNIMTTLQQDDPNILFTKRDLYNLKWKLRKTELNGRTPIKALLDQLKTGDYAHDVKCDHDGNVTHLFFAEQRSIEFTRKFSDVLLLDCTYKTNRYRMPLLNVVGMTNVGSTYFSGCCFMAAEKQSDYEWALGCFSRFMFTDHVKPKVFFTDNESALLNASKTVFPDTHVLLCQWHVNKNLTKNLKAGFTKDEWDQLMGCWWNVIESATEEDFEFRWNTLREDYFDQRHVITYLQTTWLPHKEKLVRAWTDKLTHFGNIATSRVEGAHAVLKKMLQVSTGDLKAVCDRTALVLETQQREYQAKLETDKIKVYHSQNNPLMKSLIGKVCMLYMICIG